MKSSYESYDFGCPFVTNEYLETILGTLDLGRSWSKFFMLSVALQHDYIHNFSQ